MGIRMKKGIFLLAICVFLNASYLVENFKQHCNSSNKISCAVLGLMYYNGENVKKDVKKALKYYKKACFLKEKNSCFNLYKYYKDKNIKLAKFFLKKSCKYNNKEACIILNKNLHNNQQLNKKIKLLSIK
jgi:TPR repeat protein